MTMPWRFVLLLTPLMSLHSNRLDWDVWIIMRTDWVILLKEEFAHDSMTNNIKLT